MDRLIRHLIYALLFVTQIQSVQAEAAGGAIQTKYVPIKPSLVLNYGSTGRLKYIKADVSLQVSGETASAAVAKHMPLIRNNLVLLLSRQDGETVNSVAGKETLRQLALEEVQSLMREEEGMPMVDDLLFTTFFVQR